MSTRYVWGRYSIGSTSVEKQAYTRSVQVAKLSEYDATHVVFSSSYKKQGSSYYPSGNSINADDYSSYSATSYPYAIDTDNRSVLYQAASGAKQWYITQNNEDGSRRGYYALVQADTIESDGTYKGVSFTRYYIDYEQSQGAKIDNIATPTSDQYPSNGVSGSYWYVYQGQDNIDPSISYDTKQILTKETTIKLTKSTAIQYGGTITYDYQVCVDGSSWIAVGSSTALSMNYTIPATATQFQARVRARDNMGFTSSTWVTGPLATVRAPWVHYRLHRKNAQQVYDLVHFMTSAENVVHNNTSNVQATIDNIKQRLGLS